MKEDFLDGDALDCVCCDRFVKYLNDFNICLECYDNLIKLRVDY